MDFRNYFDEAATPDSRGHTDFHRFSLWDITTMLKERDDPLSASATSVKRARDGTVLSASDFTKCRQTLNDHGPQAYAIQWANTVGRADNLDCGALEVFSYEIPYSTYITCERTSRIYEATTIDSFVRRYVNARDCDRHVYEIVNATMRRPSDDDQTCFVLGGCHLYVDIEFERLANPLIDGRKVVARVIDALLAQLHALYPDVDFESEADWFVLDSTSARKFSQHIVVRVRDGNWAFRSYLGMIDVMGPVRRQLIDEDIEAGLTRDDTSFVYEIGRDEEHRVSCIDMSVYSLRRAFRLVYSSKYGDPERRLLDAPPTLKHDHLRTRTSVALRAMRNGATYDATTRMPVDETFLRLSMINNVNTNAHLVGPVASNQSSTATSLHSSRSRRAETPVAPAVDTISTLDDDESSSRALSPSPVATVSHPVETPNVTVSNDSAPVPESLRAVLNAEPLFVRAGIDRVVYKPMAMTLHVQCRSTHCERAQRAHKSNRIYYRVYLRSAQIHGYCHSDKCRHLPRVEHEFSPEARALLDTYLHSHDAIGMRRVNTSVADDF